MSLLKKLALGTTLIAAATLSFAATNTSPLKHFSKAQQKELDTYVQTYIMDHPKVIMVSLQRMQMQARIDSMKVGQQAAIKDADLLVGSKISPTINKGPITVVEFFDYQCSVCHMVFPGIEKLAKENPNVRFVYKEFPIFGPASQYAAKVSIAAAQQGQDKFVAFHDALFKSDLMEGKLKTTDVDRIAAKSGLNMKKIQQAVKSKAVLAELKQNYKLAQDLKLSGTPAFVILPTNPKDKTRLAKITFVPGAAQPAQLQAAIKKLQ